mmetsp:Transcript_32032/g.43879  ORF Transcript_32032/g.43879 Transcript_32032/m.43879 type:complete len:373 (-) Transcript_32032:115-1233(-)|eukprot:CAMPEP_0201490730 /NCGR_PEP_ID=MMETSP0151_2-20130828/27229_1 /ASSEMBLY_ACC=CAM_ASM_000257 /TAXON_ID=200890 /ORGANISM="Paramoeba atlantica, Strain 621/1 / CCAP 1560/9" /LENGTH=372 /DNA_ID=CAMNT_0047876797 /DNA_START=91 /DNA_END=1209 /DNA_ORIENTATION=+
MAAVTESFGKEDGDEITNKDTILDEIDSCVAGVYAPFREVIEKIHGTQVDFGKPPSVEFLFVEPYSVLGKFSTNPYGHAAVRYTLRGEQIVFNIVGFGETEMVHFIHPKDYLFGTHEWKTGNEAGAIYNRWFHGIRIENVDEREIDTMDFFFRAVQAESRQSRASYSMMSAKIKNFFSGTETKGNCAVWTAKGLVRAGLVERASMWPKQIWVDLWRHLVSIKKGWFSSHKLEIPKSLDEPHQEQHEESDEESEEKGHQKKKGEKKVDLLSQPQLSSQPRFQTDESFEKHAVKSAEKMKAGEISPFFFTTVSYRRIRSRQSYGGDKDAISLVKPLMWHRSVAYRDLEKFADVIVEVPDDSMHAVVYPKEQEKD